LSVKVPLEQCPEVSPADPVEVVLSTVNRKCMFLCSLREFVSQHGTVLSSNVDCSSEKQKR